MHPWSGCTTGTAPVSNAAAIAVAISVFTFGTPRASKHASIAVNMLRSITRRSINVDSDRIEGPLKEGMGKVKEGVGDLTDNEQLESEGQADQLEGKVQNEWGEAKDGARDVLDED